MIQHRWENPENKRYYRVLFARDLFGEWLITKIWGGLRNAGGGMKNIACASYEDGIKLINKVNESRLKRGYKKIF
jgi:hypothetical protein